MSGNVSSASRGAAENMLCRYVAGDELELLLEQADHPDCTVLGSVMEIVGESIPEATALSTIALTAEFIEALRLGRALGPAVSISGSTAAAEAGTSKLVIAGLPRSGTTLLQHAFAAQGARTPVGWQLSSRWLGSGTLAEQEGAVLDVAERYGAISAVAPTVGEMHRLGAWECEECTPIFRASGQFFPWLFLLDNPDLRDILLGDFGNPTAHQHWARAISFLGDQVDVVKSPLHTGYLGSLMDVNSRGRCAVVRRPIDDIARSFGTMAHQMRVAFTDDPNPRSAGEIAIGILLALVDAARSSGVLEGDRIIVVDYDELLQSPEAVSGSLMERTGCARGGGRAEMAKHQPNYDVLSLEELGIGTESLLWMAEAAPELCMPPGVRQKSGVR